MSEIDLSRYEAHVHMGDVEHSDYVTREMALDAGDETLEGQTMIGPTEEVWQNHVVVLAADHDRVVASLREQRDTARFAAQDMRLRWGEAIAYAEERGYQRGREVARDDMLTVVDRVSAAHVWEHAEGWAAEVRRALLKEAPRE